MTPTQSLKGMGAVTAIGVLVGIMFSSGLARAWDDDHDERVIQGFKIAPVTLNLTNKDKALVGLGSYLVNASGNCNVCHSAGPETEFTTSPNRTKSGNPYFRSPPFTGETQINPATYLGGGRDFGPFPSPDFKVHIVSRNLTPDKTGKPEGGRSFKDFLKTMRTGVDLDHLHPNCPASAPQCLLPPFNGELLQIMPWPNYRHMTDHELRAIYEYLSAIPCIAGPPAPSPLHNDCR